MTRTVCDEIVSAMKKCGVREVFGIPGDAINHLVDAIRRDGMINFIQVKHEESGAFAASAQAKLTGRLSACVGTAGPGAIHLLNGLYDAKKDHAPVIAITGAADTDLLGTDTHQEIESARMFQVVSNYSRCIIDPNQAPTVVAQACQRAIANKTVSHLNLPSNVASKKVGTGKFERSVILDKGNTLPGKQVLEEATELINKYNRLTLLVGEGARYAQNEVLMFSEALNAPIVTTLKGKDIVSNHHPNNMGVLGLLGTKPAIEAIRNCDALIMIGSDFPYLDFYPKVKPTIQIDNSLERIGRRFPVTIGLVGDAKPTLDHLIHNVEKRKRTTDFLERLRTDAKSWNRYIEQREEGASHSIHPQYLAKTISDLAENDAIYTVDTGTVTVWASQHIKIRKKQRMLFSSSLASMAFSVPAAIGIALRNPDKQVIALCGDGGFAMLMAEMATAIQYKLPIKIFLFNNRKLGLIKMEQEVEGLPETETYQPGINFCKFAKLLGAKGSKVWNSSEVPKAVSDALSYEGPFLVDVEVNPNELTLPPEIKLKHALGYGKAMLKEMVA